MSKLILVLATQRTGSTLLCRDIQALDGAPAPREYLVPLIEEYDAERLRNMQSRILEKKVRMAIQLSERPKSRGLFGLKLMVSYAREMYAMLSGKWVDDPSQAMQYCIDWTLENYSAVSLVSCIRPSIIDQAVSLARVRLTKQYLMPSKSARQPLDIDVSAMNEQIKCMLPLVSVRQRTLLDIVAANDVCCIDYDELASHPTRVQVRLIEHFAKSGMDLRAGRVNRTLEKIVSQEEGQKYKSRFSRYLKDNGISLSELVNAK